MSNSDDFSTGALGSNWRFEGPSQGTIGFGSDGDEAYLTLGTPDGTFDAWQTNTTARVMQDATDEDFQIETRFLTTPSGSYQMQGILIEQDADNWLRFDTYSVGNKLYAYVGKTVNGQTSKLLEVVVPGGSAPYLRVTRTGDDWLYQYSTDGTTWTTVGTVTHELTVDAVGLFSGNLGQSSGYEAQVDYFEVASDPIVDEDGTITTEPPANQLPVAGDDAFLVDADGSLVLSGSDDLLANDTDGDGDALTITGITQPSNGTLTDNGDGTYTYTPTGGYSGTDSFTYTVTDGTDTDTATVTLTVSEPSTNTLVSDDFSTGTLGANWRLEGPSQGTVGFGSDANDAYLTLSTPDGTFDAWQTNTTARIMQDATDEDFQIETRFLSTPSGSYQLQGILIEQDDQNWMRFDTFSSGNKLYAYIGKTVNGSTSAMLQVEITGGSAPYLRVTRTGDSWLYQYSTDGSNWTTVGTVTHALTVDAAGLFSGNLAQSSGFETRVDYFEVSTDPLTDEDGGYVAENQAPVTADDAFATETDTALDFSTADLLSNDSDPDGDAVTLVSVGTPANGVLLDNGDGTWTYAPDAGFEGSDSFTYTVTDGTVTDTGTVTVTVRPPSVFDGFSDDFSASSLDDGWTFKGITGSASLATTGTDAIVLIESPAGVAVSASDVMTTPRLMQDVADGDFQISAGFLNEPQQMYQEHGLLVVQDESNWIRFDLAYTHLGLTLIVGQIVDGSTTYPLFDGSIAVGQVADFRITRTGDTFVFETSADGVTWVQNYTLTREMTVTEVGAFAGTAPYQNNQPPGYTAQLDYFETSADPILDEDGSIATNQAPVAADDDFQTDPDTALVLSEDDLLGNDSDPNDDALTVTGVSQPSNGTLTDNGDGTWTYTPDSGYSGTDSFTYTVTDGTETDTATVTVTVAEPTVNPLASDDFASGTLGANWRLEGPSQGTVGFGSDETDYYLTLGTPDGTFDAWQTNGTARIMQDAADEDFQIETHFLSTPSGSYQMQGILIEQDAQNWMRFDTYSAGTKLFAYVGKTVNGQTSKLLEVEITGVSAPYLRVTRTGDSWLYQYSTDGSTWTTVGTVNHALTVDAAGLFSGNLGQSSGFEAQVDYFEVSSDPIVDEDGTPTEPPANQTPIAADDNFTVEADGSLVLDGATDLLTNDSDPDGDTLTITEVGQPGNGTVVDNEDGTWTYTPNTGYTGTDTFTYTISDGVDSENATVTVTVEVTEPTENPLASDDFASGTLGSNWRLEGPAEGTVSFGSTSTDAYLALYTPDGTFDAWQTNTTARVMQDAADVDFQIETRFLTTPSGSYQMQGILIEQDASNWLRFDTFSSGSKLYAYVGKTVNGSTSALLQVEITGGSAPYLRVTRTDDSWLYQYSTDGNSWTTIGTVTHALTVDAAGLFSGNLAQSSGYEARVDYFEVSTDPLTDEDGTFVPQNEGPTAVADSFATTEGTPVTFSADDLLANDSDPENDTLSVTSLGQPTNGALIDNGNGTWTYTPNSGYNGVDTFTYTISDGDKSSVGSVSVSTSTVSSGGPIDVWYGDTQTFAAQGETQVWINILGNVSGQISSLSYSLNGGAAQYLAVGSDTRRLQDTGDFNVEIAYSDLNGSATDDVVTITAVMTNGQTYSKNVIVEYEDGNVWDANYSIDWSTVSDITDVVQVVDGTWAIDANGVTPVDLGYDRLLTLGDISWDNYEVSLQVTPYDLTNVDPRGRDGGGFALGMLWNGHTDTPIANAQPHVGWEPGAAFFFHDENGDGSGVIKLHPSLNFFNTLGTQAITINANTTYNIDMRVEMVGLYDRLYSIKIWEAGTAEPQDWTLQGVQTFSIDQAPATGSLYLNAHYNDLSFGDITVTEITGRDIVQGTDGDDVQVAVTNGSTDPGIGEIDVFVGAGGADTFVFGDVYGTYYDDNNASATGTEDYGFVWDFTAGTDKVQLWGDASDYTLTENASGLPEGTAIWLSLDGQEDELIGVLNDTYGLSLGSDSFIFTDSGMFV